MSSGPLSAETIARLQRASQAVRNRKSATGPERLQKHRHEQRERDRIFPDPMPPITSRAFPGATPGMNWQHLLTRTAETLHTHGAEEERRFRLQVSAIREAWRNGWTSMVAVYLAKLLLHEQALHREHGEIHNPHLDDILREITKENK